MTNFPTKTIRVSLTPTQVQRLALLLHHFTDYMAGDERPDHGWARLKDYRTLPSDAKSHWYVLAGRFKRLTQRHR